MKKRKVRPAHRTAKLVDAKSQRDAVLGVIEGRIMATGNVVLPCLPSLADAYAERLNALWAKLGRPFSEPEVAELQASLGKLLLLGFEHSPHTVLVVQYEANPPPRSNLTYSLSLRERSVESYYSEWAQKEGGAWFGVAPDARVVACARELAPAARVLDVGAGHGRNAIPLARRGLRVDAVELVPELCERLTATARSEQLPCVVIQEDLLADELQLELAAYPLIIVSEVVSHLRNLEQLDRMLSRLCASLAPSGQLVVNAFLYDDDYTPDTLAREASQVALSSAFTRAELLTVTRGLSLELISDEPALEYEREHLPTEAWPPTPWFESWASGRNVFRIHEGDPPLELRWLVYRRLP